MRKKYFTLVEIMIVVAIIGLLAAIAIPSFLKARQTSQKNACLNNLRQLSGAQQQLALETPGADVTDSTLVDDYMDSGTIPTCPADDDAYVLTTDGVTCPNADELDHELP